MESINNMDKQLLTLGLSKQWKLSKLGEALITVLATYMCQSTTVLAGANIYRDGLDELTSRFIVCIAW